MPLVSFLTNIFSDDGYEHHFLFQSLGSMYMGLRTLFADFIARFAMSPTCAGTAVRALHMQHGAIKRRLTELIWKRKSSPDF